MDISPLGRLPPELRNQIYEFTFTLEDDNIFEDGYDIKAGDPPLTQTCRQIRLESLTLAYSVLTHLTASIGPGQVRSFSAKIKQMHSRGHLRQLKQLTVDCSLTYIYDGHDGDMTAREVADWRQLARTLACDARLSKEQVSWYPEAPVVEYIRGSRSLHSDRNTHTKAFGAIERFLSDEWAKALSEARGQK